ncbi:MAG: hypothetical protein ACK5XB_11925, partial [Rhodospirillales bacterium]
EPDSLRGEPPRDCRRFHLLRSWSLRQSRGGSVSIFERHFKENAKRFDYSSAQISDVEIDRDTLIPCLSKLELRQIRRDVRADIKSDSSASDFVRLIWSYLFSLYQTSIEPQVRGNHPGLIMLDEPGQHSMAVNSQQALLKMLGEQRGLQSIVAASFDESEEVFQVATNGAVFELIEWDGRLIKPV